MVRVPTADDLLGQEDVSRERTRYDPSQSAKSLLKEYFELNLPSHLDADQPTTRFSADQLIQFASAVGLKSCDVSLRSQKVAFPECCGIYNG